MSIIETMKKEKKHLFKRITALVCAVASVVGCMGALSGCSRAKKNTQIIITEVVASNRYSLTASDGTSPDWVELYNPTDKPADLSGYGLTDNSAEPYRFTFPEGTTLGADEYMIVYCTGTEDTSNADGILRAGFKISSAGETICVSGRKDQILYAIDLPELEQDVSYGIAEHEEAWVYYAQPTPAQPNSGECNDTGIFEKEAVSADLVINEFMAENRYSIRAADGAAYPWVEIRNVGSEAVNLSGFGLTDDETNPNKWSFPEIELAPGALQLVFLSGENRSADGELHAGLSLSTEDSVLMLCDAMGNIVDYVTPMETDGSVSIGLYGENLVYFAEPTPNAENTTEPYTDLAAAEAYLPAVYISEAKSSSEDDIDWIELHNGSDQAIDLSGYGLSDSNDELYRYTFADTVLQPGEYTVVDCAEAQISLARSGEMIYLTDTNGIIVDNMNCGTQNIEISRGRKAGGDNTVYYFASATKGAENTAEVFESYASAPAFSRVGGIVDSGTKIEITAPAGNTIYYTTDGSAPTASDAQYTGPITITESTPLRARCYADGKLASTVTTENYLVGVDHDIPIVCISIAPSDFSGSEKGIYAKGAKYDWEDNDGSDYAHTLANYWQDWEREMNFEWFEEDGTKGVDFDAGIKIFGQFSRELGQKSFAIKLRGQYGQKSVTYPFFRDHDITTFYNLVLRQSGQDCGKTKIKDAMIAQVCKDTNVEVMEYRPCAVYINGEYWGLYNLREKQDADYVVSRYPEAQKDTIDVVKGDYRVNAGDSDGWREMINYVKSHDMTQLESQTYIEERVNLYSLYDWIAIEAFIANTDTGNKRKFNYDGGKWTWMLFDTDWALQAAGSNSVNRLDNLMHMDHGHGSGNAFTTAMHRAIRINSKWRKEFVERYAELLNTTLRPERFHAIIDAMADEIRSEMPAQVERWDSPESVETWEKNIEDLKATVDSRWPAAVKELKSTFGLSDERMAELFPDGY